MFSKSFAILFLFSLVVSQEVTGIFTKFNSLRWEKAADYPFQGPRYPNWIADLSWMIDGSRVSKGDTFTLHMPYVFKFTTTEREVNLRVGENTFATCSFAPGNVVVDYSELQCVVSDSVGASTYAYGTVHFPFSFNSGGSGLEVDLRAARAFHAGTNTISFYDGNNELSIDTSFVGGAETDANVIIRTNRIIPTLDTQQHYLLAGNCANGYQKATIGFSVMRTGVILDCNSMHALITDKLNDWYYPESATDVRPTVACNSDELSVTFGSISRGFRPFADIFMKVDTGVLNQVKYINQYQCVGSSSTTDNLKTVTWGEYQNDDPGANGQEVIVTTQTWTGLTTRITTLPYTTGTGTITIEVNVPIPTVTTTTTCHCPHATSTFTATPGDTATVIEYIPKETTQEEASSTAEEESTTSSSEEATITEDEESSTTSEEEASSTEEDESTTTSNEDASSTEEEESSTTPEEEASSTEDEESSTSSNEAATSTEDEESTITSNKDASSTEADELTTSSDEDSSGRKDEESSATSNEDGTSTEKVESSTTSDEQVSTSETPYETSSNTESSTSTHTEEESTSEIEESTSLDTDASIPSISDYTISTEESSARFETSSDTEESATTIVEESSSSFSNSPTIEIETSSDLDVTTSAIETLTTSSNEEPSTPETTEVSVLSESTTRPIEESSSVAGHEGESSTTLLEESLTFNIESSESQTLSTNVSESHSIQEPSTPAGEDSSTFEASTLSTRYITSTIIDGSTTTFTVSEATTTTVGDEENSGIASSESAGTFDTTSISETKVGHTDADYSVTTTQTVSVTSPYNELTQWTTGSTLVPSVPETILGSASSFTFSATLVIFIEIFAAFIL